MDSWVITIISLIGSTALSTLVGLLIKNKVSKKMDEQEELLELRQREVDAKQKASLEQALIEGLKPLSKQITDLSTLVGNSTRGTITLLREDMKRARDRLIDQRFASASDVASWHELYHTYTALGGNHFREYVDAWKEDVDDLPRERKEN